MHTKFRAYDKHARVYPVLVAATRIYILEPCFKRERGGVIKATVLGEMLRLL